MAALQRIRMPNQIVIPFAVMLRYLPVVREDWHYIKDAMRMRDIAPSVKKYSVPSGHDSRVSVCAIL